MGKWNCNKERYHHNAEGHWRDTAGKSWLIHRGTADLGIKALDAATIKFATNNDIFDIPVFELDDKTTILNRLSASLNTLSKYLYFPKGDIDLQKINSEEHLQKLIDYDIDVVLLIYWS